MIESRAAHVNGNRALLGRLLRDIVADHSGDLDRLSSCLGQSDEAIRITHSLKTVFGTLGGSQLQIEFASLERQLKASMPASPTGLVANIEQPFHQVMTEIEVSQRRNRTRALPPEKQSIAPTAGGSAVNDK